MRCNKLFKVKIFLKLSASIDVIFLEIVAWNIRDSSDIFLTPIWVSALLSKSMDDVQSYKVLFVRSVASILHAGGVAVDGGRVRADSGGGGRLGVRRLHDARAARLSHDAALLHPTLHGAVPPTSRHQQATPLQLVPLARRQRCPHPCQ